MEFHLSSFDETLILVAKLMSVSIFFLNLYVDRLLITYDEFFQIHLAFSGMNYCFGLVLFVLLFRFYQLKKSGGKSE